MGSDRAQARYQAAQAEFQFALPHGERRLRGRLHLISKGFNSRSRMGSDPNIKLWNRGNGGFNSRSRMGSDVTVVAYL